MKGLIGIAGNIGVGKTTFATLVAEHLGWKAYYESVIDNPYLGDFYGNMHRWSFHLQIYFLHHRFRSQVEMARGKQGAVQDRTIYEDVEIFARNLYEMGNMTARDWENYRELFSIMTAFLRKPDLIIYLRATTDTLLTRIHQRNRDYERTIDPAYLHRLNVSYERWIARLRSSEPVMIVDTDGFDVFHDRERLETIFKDIKLLLKA